MLPEEGSGGGKDFGWAVAKNERRRMEDAVDVKDDVAGFRMFTVYDGHAGDEAVTVVKKILPDILETHFEKDGDVEKAICLAFRHIDEELARTLLFAADTPTKVKISSGTVACMALMKGTYGCATSAIAAPFSARVAPRLMLSPRTMRQTKMPLKPNGFGPSGFT